MVAFRLNLLFCPQDFSMGKILQGQKIIESNGNWNDATLSAFKESVGKIVKTAVTEFQEFAGDEGMHKLISECQSEISNAVVGDGSGWVNVFPGRRILEEYARNYKLGKPPVLQNCIINELAAQPERIPEELRNLVVTASKGEPFNEHKVQIALTGPSSA